MHRPDQFFTPTKLYYDSPRRVDVGDFICGSGGATYLVQQVRRSPTRRHRKYLRVLRFDPSQVPPGATVHPLYRYARRRRVRPPRPPRRELIDDQAPAPKTASKEKRS